MKADTLAIHVLQALLLTSFIAELLNYCLTMGIKLSIENFLIFG